jgi:hypothetical protein
VEPPPSLLTSRRCRLAAAIVVEPLPLSWSRRHCFELPPSSSLSPRRCGLANTVTTQSRRCCCGAANVVVVATSLMLSLSCRRCRGAAVIIVEPTPLLWNRRHCKTKKKKTKTKTKKKKKKKKKKKTMKKKKKQLLRSHYNMLKESATLMQSPCRQGMCCPKSPTRHQPHPTLTLGMCDGY